MLNKILGIILITPFLTYLLARFVNWAENFRSMREFIGWYLGALFVLYITEIFVFGIYYLSR